MAGIIKNTLIVSGSTIGSRFLGLFRDIIFMALIPLGPLNAAFVLAFTLPNLFRRLMGEGALTSSFVPVLSDTLHKEGKPQAFSLINKMVSRTAVALGAISVLGLVIIAIYHLGGFVTDEKEEWACRLSYILFPYVFFVCMAALFAGALNTFGKFAVAAMSAVWLNLCMIGSMLLGKWLFTSLESQLYMAASGVLLGGIIQVILPWMDLKKLGWHFQKDFSGNNETSHVARLFIPSVAAASVMQINILISRFIAFNIDDNAISLYYLANRLMELPLGLFTVALTTVFFPELSKSTSSGNHAQFRDSFYRATRFVLAINIASAAGIIILRYPLIATLFQHGKFTAESVMEMTPITAVFALTLPWYSLSAIATKAFHAQKEMKTPMKIAIGSVIINIVLSFGVLFFDLGVVGLAWANFISGGFQAITLMILLLVKNEYLRQGKLMLACAKMAVACAIMSSITYGLWYYLQPYAKGTVSNILVMAIIIPIAAAVYFLTLYFLHFEDKTKVKDIIQKLIKRLKRQST